MVQEVNPDARRFPSRAEQNPGRGSDRCGRPDLRGMPDQSRQELEIFGMGKQASRGKAIE